MSYCSACITPFLPGLATVFFPVEKTIFRTPLSLISSLRVKKEYKTIYIKRLRKNPVDYRRAPQFAPLARCCLFGIFVLDVDGGVYPSRSRYVHTEVRGSALRKDSERFSALGLERHSSKPKRLCCFHGVLRKTKSIPYEIRRTHLIEDYPDTL